MRSFQIALAVSLVALCAAAAAPLRAQVTVAPSPGDSSAAIAGAFDQIDRAELALSPIGKMNRGIRDGDYGKWDDFSEAGEAAGYRALADAAASLRHDFDPARLSPKDAMSFRLFQSRAKRAAAYDAVRSDVYAFHQHLSWQSSIPALLVNQHSIANEAQAEAYVARIAGLGAIADAKTDVARARAAGGVIPPKWVFPLVLSEVDGMLKSDAAPDLAGNALIDDFRAKIAKLDLPEARKAVLIQAAISAWTQSAAPAFRRFRAEVAREEPLAGTVDGVWRLPNGKQYYDTLLAWHTTTDLNADQIHELGLSETARIQDEMRGIMRKVGFAGTLQQFFDYTRTDPRFFHATPRSLSRRRPKPARRRDREAARLVRDLAQGPAAGEGGRAVPREGRDQGFLRQSLAGRVAARHLLCQSLQSQGDVEERGRGARFSRGHSGPSPPALDPIWIGRGARLPPLRLCHRLHRGLGALCRAARARRWASTPIPMGTSAG